MKDGLAQERIDEINAKITELTAHVADLDRAYKNAKGDLSRADNALKTAAAVALEMGEIDKAQKEFNKLFD